MHVARVVIIGGLLGLIAIGVLATVVAEGARDRVRTRPIDMTEVQHRLGFHAPYSVTSFVKRDGIAFRAHALLATLIARSTGAPSAVAVQRFKAAAHARTDSQQVIRGLEWAQQHSADRVALQTSLCPYVENGYWTGLQHEALTAMGFQCPGSKHR